MRLVTNNFATHPEWVYVPRSASRATFGFINVDGGLSSDERQQITNDKDEQHDRQPH